MLKLATLTTIFLLTLVPASAADREPGSPHIDATNEIVFRAHGLMPGTRYAITYQALSQEDDPAPYCLGGEITVNRAGNVWFPVDLATLVYGSGKPVVEVRIWLRDLGTGCEDPPAMDQDGLPLLTELDLY